MQFDVQTWVYLIEMKLVGTSFRFIFANTLQHWEVAIEELKLMSSVLRNQHLPAMCCITDGLCPCESLACRSHLHSNVVSIQYNHSGAN